MRFEERHSSASLAALQEEPFPGQVLRVRGLGKTHTNKHVHLPEWGINATADFTSCLSKKKILVGFEPPRHTRIYTRTEMSMLLYPAYTYFFSLTLAHTLTHTQGLGTSRLVALTHFLCFEAASGEMAFPIIAFEACVRRRRCVCIHGMGEGKY